MTKAQLIKENARLKAENRRMKRAIGDVYHYMNGVFPFQYGWVNYPNKPDQTPASILKRFL